MTTTQDNDGDFPTVFIIVGRVWENDSEGGEETAIPVNILLQAPDDDSAVRQALERLAAEGYVEAEFDQIGVLTEEPDNPTYEAAYQDALEGNVAVIAFHD
ncbi:regulator [Stappia sp. GBMRC 2046]|uniref:Regulator n=1 Tax=Stappia sediminis TaxID=2692190 RepID=A0A7X3S6L8_9HYPH|nr:regulator [Stappia sediminis]MXN64052.1 regulator [Stappia sediminis]